MSIPPIVEDYAGISSVQGVQRGQARTISRGQTIGVLRGSSVGGRGMGCVLSLSRAAVEELPVTGHPPPRIVGRLVYLPQGDTVRFDWLTGTLLAVPSGDFDLQASYPDDFPLEPAYPQRISALVAPTTRSGGAGPLSQARLTELVITAPATTAYVRVPARAIGYSLALPVAYPAGGAIVQQLGGWVGGAPYVVARTPIADAQTVVPLAGDAAWISWAYDAALATARVIWSLAL